MTIASRRKREIARIRGDILEAAARAFGRGGSRRVTMQDIAREAGYTAASLYTYFKGKREISEALVAELTNEYQETFESPLPAGLTFSQKLETILRRQLELADRRRAVFVSVLNMPNDSVDECHSKLFHKNFEDRIRRLADWIAREAKPEDLGGNEPDIAARFLVGFVFALMHRWMLSASKGRFVDQVPLVLDLFFNGFRGPIEATRKATP